MKEDWPASLLRGLLALLIGLVSSQYALRDPRTQVLPVSFLPGLDVCRAQYPAPASSKHSHTSQPHCPLCIMGGFSDGAVGLPEALGTPSQRWLGHPSPPILPRPFLTAVFTLQIRGPPSAV